MNTDNGVPQRSDLIAAPLLVVLALVVMWETSDYPASLVPGSPGPALVPRVLAGLLGGLALMIGVRAWITRRRLVARHAETSWLRVGLTTLLSGLFLWTVTFGDVFILLPFYLAALMLGFGERHWKTVAIVPLLFDLFVYLVFYRTFGVPLPTVLF